MTNPSEQTDKKKKYEPSDEEIEESINDFWVSEEMVFHNDD